MVMRFLMRKQWGTAPKLSKETRSQNLKNFMLQSSALLSLNSNSFVISSTEAENWFSSFILTWSFHPHGVSSGKTGICIYNLYIRLDIIYMNSTRSIKQQNQFVSRIQARFFKLHVHRPIYPDHLFWHTATVTFSRSFFPSICCPPSSLQKRQQAAPQRALLQLLWGGRKKKERKSIVSSSLFLESRAPIEQPHRLLLTALTPGAAQGCWEEMRISRNILQQKSNKRWASQTLPQKLKVL